MNDLPQTPEAQGAALSELKNHPGWGLFCARFKADMDALAVQVLEEADDAKAARLRAQWQKLREFEPVQIRDRMEKSARSRAQKSVAT